MTGEAPNFNREKYESMVESLEDLLGDVEPRLYPNPGVDSDNRSSIREKNIMGGAFEGLRVQESTSYSKDDPEVNSRLRVFYWRASGNHPAATDYGAWQADIIWSVDVEPSTDTKLIEALEDLVAGRTDEHDPRFEIATKADKKEEK